MGDIMKEYGLVDSNLAGGEKLHWAASMLASRHDQARASGTVWAIAAKTLIYDLVEVVEGDYSNTVGFTMETNQARARALRATRAKLPKAFLDFLLVETGEMACTQSMVGSQESNSSAMIWYGKGGWVATVSLK
ncbi:hypothetical protein B0T14DRAFT_565448 [Immersiella caudata]|uniref:Uncharacterized protein n=1 Tax=Immersiella caudata TaxID=314043 RepID=A0AA39WYX0_9PEZI|nr:hypothetical protein B0T14DRAFT_565448 [Immersiella caudata]